MYLVLALTFEEYNKNKHAASWLPAPALWNKTPEGLCILPGGAPTHRRWYFNNKRALILTVHSGGAFSDIDLQAALSDCNF
jgi:hypothetical protein